MTAVECAVALLQSYSKQLLPHIMYLHVYILTTAVGWCVNANLVSFFENNYEEFNDIPKSIFYGLMTEGATVEELAIVNGTCLQYDPNSFDRCKFYGDCCAMIPVRKEQLERGTFSCHSGYYIVDKCPRDARYETVRRQCEEDLSKTGESISVHRYCNNPVLVAREGKCLAVLVGKRIAEMIAYS